MLLSPTVKQTGQEWDGQLCEIFKVWSFLQSKSVNIVWKLLSFWWTKPYIGTLPLDPQDLLGYCPWSENSWRRHWADSVVFSWHGSKCTQMRWLKVPDYQWTWVHYEILGLCVLCRSADLRAFTVYSLVSILTRDDRVSDGARFLRRVTDTYIRWQWR